MQSRDVRNLLLNVSGEGLWGFQAAMVASATVLTVLLRDLGAHEGMIGSISAIEGGLLIAPQFLGNYIFSSRRRRKPQLMNWHFLAVLPFLVLMGVLAHPAIGMTSEVRRWLLLGCFALYILSIGIVGAAWIDWLGHVFNKRIRGTVLGMTFAVAAGMGVAGAMAAGWAIGSAPGLNTYSWLYLIAAAIGALAIFVLYLIDDPVDDDTPEPPPLTAPVLLGRFAQSLSDRNFRRFLIGRLMATSGFCILPFVAVYYTSPAGGGLGNGQLVWYSSIQSAGMAVAGYAFGRLGDARGHRVGILIGVGAQMAALAVMLASGGKISCLLAYLAVGACMGANTVSHFNMLLETCPHEHRLAHITVGNMVISTAAIIAPLLSAAVAAHWGLRTLFAVCLLLSLAALAWFFLRVRDPRDEKLLADVER